MDFLSGTPYTLSSEAQEAMGLNLKAIDERVRLLRENLILTSDTLRRYYGERRFEQVAESNALEGSTLSVGETELAVCKGITITGHDPAFTRDAVSLDTALQRVAELAKSSDPVDIDQLLEVHGLILGERPEAGRFRNVPVRLGGSEHRPPKSLQEVSDGMREWQDWSRNNATTHPIARAVVLHAWLTHIHPFTDGNGRTARALTTLELVRGGYPPIIIKKAEKPRYLSGLWDSDSGGDLSTLFELFYEKSNGALLGLENAAKTQQGFNPVALKIREQQARYAKIWAASVHLLAEQIEHYFSDAIAAVGGKIVVRKMFQDFDPETWASLCQKDSSAASWAFTITADVPGFSKFEILAYFGHRSSQMFHHFSDQGGVSLFWSKANPDGYPRWRRWNAPFGCEMSLPPTGGAEWHVRFDDGSFRKISGRDFAEQVAQAAF